MGLITKIQWTDHTFNPWRGCTKVSEGCKFCYADRQSKRNPGVLGVWGPNGTRVVAAEAYWKQPIAWNKEASAAGERRRVFCASLADVFEASDTMPAEAWPAVVKARDRLFTLIMDTPALDWLLLTKRPANIPAVMAEACWRETGCPMFGVDEFPPNLWLGASIEDQKAADSRYHTIRHPPASIRFLSMEPLIGPVELPPIANGTDVDWAIIGGESGPGARPCRVEWIDSLIKQCRQRGIVPFVKQLGANVRCTDAEFGDIPIDLKDPKGGNPDEWPEDLRVREFPTHKSV